MCDFQRAKVIIKLRNKKILYIICYVTSTDSHVELFFRVALHNYSLIYST